MAWKQSSTSRSPLSVDDTGFEHADMHGIDVVEFVRKHEGYSSILSNADDEGRRGEPRGCDERGRVTLFDQPFLPNILAAHTAGC